ncbi:MAG: hypothetical protein KKC01_01515 [Gammaproteobacteria bacterium]|nr:hypothetical protein [Gammaproteobacteria bacterium]
MSGEATGSDVSEAGEHAHNRVTPVYGISALTPGPKRHGFGDLTLQGIVVAFGNGIDVADVILVCSSVR